MNTDEFIEIFEQYRIDDSIEDHSLTLYLMLRKPTDLDYLVTGVMDSEERIALSSSRRPRKQPASEKPNVGHNFRYYMHGTASGPEGCFEAPCELNVNGGGVLDYLDYERRGIVGSGRFTRGVFNLRLSVAPEIARNIVQRRLIAPQVEQAYEEDEDEGHFTVWMRLSLDILHLKKRRDNWVDFYIGRTYFSSIFAFNQFH